MHGRIEIAPLGEGELRSASRLLGAAFRDNPMNLAVLARHGPAARVRANAAGLRAQLRVALRHGRVVAAREQGQLRGVLISLPPRAHPPPAPPLLERLRVLLLQGPRVALRWASVSERLRELHPLEPHGYLSILGVDPAQRGRGVGSRLLAGFVEHTDREGLPAYLETDAESNLRFYGRVGFAVEGELEILGVRVWRLRRAARGRETA